MIRLLLVPIALAACALIAVPAYAQQTLSGAWTISSSNRPGMVQLELRLGDSSGEGHYDSSDSIPLSDLHLSQAQLNSSGSRVTFALHRDAGEVAFTGWLQQGGGGGTFVFTPDQGYERELAARGYQVTEPHKLLTAAMLDLSPPYIDSVNAAGLGRIEYDKLIAFKALKVDQAYIRQMRSRFPDVDASKVISLRALNVDDAYLNELQSIGLTPENAGEAVSLKALHVDAAYVRDLASVGYTHLAPHDLVTLRAMGIDSSYVRRLEAHGFHNLSVQKLVESKALGII